MKKIIWIVGPSASGKETFIRYALENNSIHKLLGWEGIVSVSQESLKNTGAYDEDPVIKQRENILEEVVELTKKSDIVLIKWQYVDSKKDRPERLKALLTRARHSAIILQVDKADLKIQRQSKIWVKDNGNSDQVIELEFDYIQKFYNRFKENFPVTFVRNDGHGGYKILP